MSDSRPSAPGRALSDWLAEISRKRLTGRLEVDQNGPDKTLFFVGGDFYLAPDHPAYRAAEAWVTESRGLRPVEDEDPEGGFSPANGTSAPPFRQLAGPILTVLGATSEKSCTFQEGAGKIPIDLAGPLPTKQLIMELAVRGLDDQGLLRRLGGDKVLLRAVLGVEDAVHQVQLQPEEGFLLSRLDTPATVQGLLKQLDMSRSEALRSLCRLQAIGLVLEAEPEPAERRVGESGQQLLKRFEARIGESLAEKALDIEIEQHREVLKNLLSRMGEMTYFEMLAVTPQSSDSDVHTAYFELGRLVHPSHTLRLGLEGKEGAFRVLFERATEAYLTLSDPERKLAYQRSLGPAAQQVAAGQSDETRDFEKQEVARRSYERALVLAERQDFHSAIQLLEQAVKVDPQPEYLTLLGDCQAENPQWLDRATMNFQRALQARPGDPSIYSRLGHAFERLGRREAASSAYEAALEVAPEMESARAGLLRVGGDLPGRERSTGWTERLKRFFRLGGGSSS